MGAEAEVRGMGRDMVMGWGMRNMGARGMKTQVTDTSTDGAGSNLNRKEERSYASCVLQTLTFFFCFCGCLRSS